MKNEQLTVGQFHRQIAVESNNSIWSVLNKIFQTSKNLLRPRLGIYFTIPLEESRSHSEHSSGRILDLRVFSAMGQGELAFIRATKCLDLIQSKNEIANKLTDKGLMKKQSKVFADYDLPFAYEALARACAVLGQYDDCQADLVLAEKTIEKVKDSENRRICQNELDKVRCTLTKR